MPAENEASASTLFMAAWSYRNVMKLIVDKVDGPGNHNLGAPFALLTGFALELGFKSTLVAHGASEKELRAIGHSIRGAMLKAFEVGLIPKHRLQLERVAALLEEPHLHLQMRYIPAGVESIRLPGPDASLNAVDDLLDSIWAQFPKIGKDMPK